MNVMIVSPAYGRDYGVGRDDNEENVLVHQEILKDWQEGKDFMIHAPMNESGRYINKQDFLKYCENVDQVNIRFNKLQDVVVLKKHHCVDSLAWQIGGYVEPDKSVVIDTNNIKGKTFKLIKDVVLKKDHSVFAQKGETVTASFEENKATTALLTNKDGKVIRVSIGGLCEFCGIKKPTEKQLEKWCFDSICKSIFGEKVEPDGWDDLGSPSWLLAMSLV